jgi:hypothetical protein
MMNTRMQAYNTQMHTAELTRELSARISDADYVSWLRSLPKPMTLGQLEQALEQKLVEIGDTSSQSMILSMEGAK